MPQVTIDTKSVQTLSKELVGQTTATEEALYNARITAGTDFLHKYREDSAARILEWFAKQQAVDVAVLDKLQDKAHNLNSNAEEFAKQQTLHRTDLETRAGI